MNRDASDPADRACLVEAVHRLVGRDKAIAVQEALGGANIYVPHTADERHWLTQIIGLQGMQRVAAELGGCLASVPKSETKAERHRELILLFSLARIPVSIIAFICDLSPRHVSSIRAQLRAEAELPASFSSKPKKRAFHEH